MPRGPGKKENYNLDYSRFNKFDNLEEEDVKGLGSSRKEPEEADADAAGGPMPDMREMLRGMPPELQEAYHLMTISRQTGDVAAQQRASELALRAVRNGTPEVKQSFLENMSEQMPDAVDTLTQELDSGKDASDVLKNLQEDAVRRKCQAQEAEDTKDRIDSLRKQMEDGQQATRKELDNLQKKQEELEKIRSPEEFFKFMSESGLGQEDFQRIFSGDEKHMQARFNEVIEKQIGNGVEKKVSQDSAEALKAAEELHSNLFGPDEPEKSEPAEPPPAEKPKEKKEKKKPEEPEVIIPMYRLQYEKDDAGRYTSVELKCSLPGIADMSAINLDISDKHLRLSTCAPAPRYAVNAGPFPVLIDPNSARAKYSKKREELSISVPAKLAA